METPGYFHYAEKNKPKLVITDVMFSDLDETLRIERLNSILFSIYNNFIIQSIMMYQVTFKITIFQSVFVKINI